MGCGPSKHAAGTAAAEPQHSKKKTKHKNGHAIDEQPTPHHGHVKSDKGDHDGSHHKNSGKEKHDHDNTGKEKHEHDGSGKGKHESLNHDKYQKDHSSKNITEDHKDHSPKKLTEDHKDHSPKKLTVLVIGGPGSGRGPLCEHISYEYGFMHISSGKLLKVDKNKEPSTGKDSDLQTKTQMITKHIKDAIHKHPHIIIDGFPSTLSEAKTFEDEIGKPNLIVYLDYPQRVLEERLTARAEKKGDPAQNKQVEKIKAFEKDTIPILEHYEQKNSSSVKRIKLLHAKDKPFPEVEQIFKSMFSLEPHSILLHKKHDCSKKIMIFILGGPGSGKGTQCAQMVREFGYTHVSMGDLLRNEVKLGTKTGKEIDRMMAEGQLVPLEITMSLLENAIHSAKCKRFLIDGGPRSIEQVQALEKKIGDPSLVLNLKCSMETMEKRILERGKTSKRIDDNIETIKRRFATYEKESKPVVEYYKNSKPNLLKEVSTELDAEHIYKEIRHILKDTIEK